MNILNLYAGLGGNRKHWTGYVTNVERHPKLAETLQKMYPHDRVIIADAHQYLLDHADEYDFIWSSRPCQSHTRMMKFTRHKLKRYPDMGLYEEIIFLQHFFKGKWVVENVMPYYEPLIKPTLKIGRHLFWSNMDLKEMENPPKSPKDMINTTTVAKKQVMMDWLGIHYKENIYYEGNHCPVQVLRNCVHPEIGLHIFKQAV